MPVSTEFLRGVLGLIGIGCAYMMGRSAGWQKRSRIYGWGIRTAACMIALAIRHTLDATEIAVWLTAAAMLAVGYWATWRTKPEEDLTKTIFNQDE